MLLIGFILSLIFSLGSLFLLIVILLGESGGNYQRKKGQSTTRPKLSPADKALEIQARSEALLSSIADGVIATDRQGQIMFVNDAAQKMIGWNVDELRGKLLDEVLVIKDKEGKTVATENRPLNQALKTGRRKETRDFFFVRKDKSEFPVEITSSRLTVRGRVVGAIEVFRDITKEKEVDEARIEFVSLVSHQLRESLSAIKWSCEMLLAGDVGKMPKDQRKLVVSISQSNERMIHLINVLLYLSRIESDRIRLEPQSTDLAKFLSQLLDDFKNNLEAKQLKLHVSVADNLSKVRIDPKLIREVYGNLIDNAIKYTPKNGKISISISKRGDKVISCVSDTGVGIPKKEQSRVFKKFYRGSNVVGSEKVGSGLGLHLVKRFVEVSGGKVWFKSKQNKGSTFCFSLPFLGPTVNKG